MLPRIAIPEPTSADPAYNQRSLPQYIRALEASGAAAVPIPLDTPEAAQAKLLASCSGILLPGSPADLDPERYGQIAAEKTAPKDVARENADTFLLDHAFQQGMPVLGICFGLQSLNVWRQGTLIQDLPSAFASAASKVNHAPGREIQNAHAVRLAPGSRLARVTSFRDEESGSRGELMVNSSHHQAIGEPGQRLNVVATSALDGVIEGLEGDDPGQFVMAVQWHPERSYGESAASRAIFLAFVDAARAWAGLRDATGISQT